jgi:hypothetical protein
VAVFVDKLLPPPDSSECEAPAPTHLTLRTTSDGCALVDSSEKVVFYADGLGGRRECLRHARERGVLALL